MVNRAIMIALIGIGLYAFFALVDLVKTKRKSEKVSLSVCHTKEVKKR